MTGATAVDVYGRVTAFDDDPRTSLEGRRAREALASNSDPAVLTRAGAALARRYLALAPREPAAAQQAFELAERCYLRALEKRPGDQALDAHMGSLYANVAFATPDVQEKIRLLEKAASCAHPGRSRDYLLGLLAEAHFDQGQFDAAARVAQEMLQSANGPSSSAWTRVNMVHQANIILGRLALKKANVAEARERLIAAARIPDSPQMKLYGPQWTLAQELLAAGQRDAVLEYIALCGKFWKKDDGRLDAWAAAIRSGDTPDFSGKLAGAAARAFRLKDLAGSEHALEAYRGKVVLLEFWATWCAPCQKEMADFEKLHHELAGKDVAILAVDVGEDRDKVAEFIRKEKYTLPVLLSEDRKVSNWYAVSAFPTLVVIDRAGKIAPYLVGGLSEPQLRAIIERARSGALAQSPSPASGGAACAFAVMSTHYDPDLPSESKASLKNPIRQALDFHVARKTSSKPLPFSTTFATVDDETHDGRIVWIEIRSQPIVTSVFVTVDGPRL